MRWALPLEIGAGLCGMAVLVISSLFLKEESMKSMYYLKNVTTLRVNVERCTGCGMCLEVCPHDVLALENRRVHIARRDACMECGACSRNCPVGAVSVDAGVGCAAAVINSMLKRKGGACCCTIDAKNSDPFQAGGICCG